jgi:hypothetical protein
VGNLLVAGPFILGEIWTALLFPEFRFTQGFVTYTQKLLTFTLFS